jgi:hypothetical protein
MIRAGEINVLFVVDIFNEGVDIPEVDTLLFLRPTESLTIFLQQLGRGLRLADDKECCTVLDFVGNSRPEYDFSQKFRALVGKTNRAISDEIKQGFPHAPLGCRIELSKRNQEMVLQNIRQATLNLNRLLGLIRQFPQHTHLPLTLANFLKIHPHISLEDIYKRSCWTDLVDKATHRETSEQHKQLISAFERAVNTRLLGCDAANYLRFLMCLCQQHFELPADTDPRMALMCHYDFWQNTGSAVGFPSLAASLKALDLPVFRDELSDLITLLINRIHHEQSAMPLMNANPLQLHARYAREQILVGFGATTFEQRAPAREGVLELKDQNVELLFVTLNKSEKQFSPSTMYHDYAISERLFHWQSQNSARPERGKGLSYIQHRENGKRIFLFVREQSKDEHDRTMGFVNFGEVEYVAHTGSQPMNITWRLKQPMPSFMWKQAAKLAID